MKAKIFLLCALAVLSSAWTEEGNVLVLTGDDFSAALKEFSHILVEFYAPWCGHCNRLAPVYEEVANELKAQNSVVRLAKVDATTSEELAKEYGVKGYPTLIFFLNGERIDYSGQRSKDSMANWLIKKTREAVTAIEEEAYKALSSAPSVSIVYHGDISSAQEADTLKKLAIADDYNLYYWGMNLGGEQGTIEMIRNFGPSISYASIDDGLESWVFKNQRPLIVPFDERTIGEIFGSNKLGLVLFNYDDNPALLELFTEVSTEYAERGEQPMVFTEITSKSEHLQNFADYIKVDHKATPIVLIEAGNQSKYVLKDKPTRETITAFLANYAPHKHGMTDEVKIELETKEPETKQAET